MSLLLQKWINDRVKRFGISAGGALLITFGIFWLMQYMIGVDNKDRKVEKSFEIADFVRIKQRGTEVEHKQRAKHRKPPISINVLTSRIASQMNRSGTILSLFLLYFFGNQTCTLLFQYLN